MKGQTLVVTGVKKIDRRLATLAGKVQKKIVRDNMRAGQKLMAAEVVSRCPVDKGLMRKGVKVRAAKRSRNKIAINTIISSKITGLKKTSSKTHKTVFYPAIVEYGSKNKPPNPFMREAYEAKCDTVRKRVIEGIRRDVDEQVRKG